MKRIAAIVICLLLVASSEALAQGTLSPQGDITSVGATANMGLTGGASKGAALLGLLSTCANGQVLVSGASGTTWTCAANGGGSISGTTNTIAKFTSATVIGDSTITDTGSLVTVANRLTTTVNANNVDTLTVNNTRTANTTSGLKLIKADATTMTFDLATDKTVYGVFADTRAPNVAGCGAPCTSQSGQMTNTALYGNAQGGTKNYALYTEEGSVLIQKSVVVKDTSNATAGAIQAQNIQTSVPGSRLGVAGDIRGSTDSTSAIMSNYGVWGTATATRSAGGNNVINYGILAEASGGQINYAYYGSAGLFYNAGAGTFASTLQVDGTSTLTGLVTATAGVTTAANLTTTGTGDLVSGDDLTVADAATITGILTSNGQLLVAGTNSKIYGTGQSVVNITDAGARGGTLRLLAGPTAADAGGTLTFGVDTSDLGFAAIRGRTTDGGSNTAGHLSFLTRNASGDTSLTERMVIGQTGGVTMYGALTVNGNTTLGDAAGDILDFNGDLAKFGATDGLHYFYGASMNGSFATNATATVGINAYGYNNGTTQFRDLVVYDGKLATVATFTGSTKSLAVAGDVQALFVTGKLAAAPTLSSCGTSPTITTNSTNLGGKFTTGSGATGCVVTFNGTAPATPVCLVATATGGSNAVVPTSVSTTAVTMTGMLSASTAYQYICTGSQ